MTLKELYNLLVTTGLPVAYSHFTETPENPVPNPPFITYHALNSTNFFADNKVYKKVDKIQVDLYTSFKDLEVEKTLEDALGQSDIPYEVSYETWLESEKLFQKIYYIGVI